MGFFVGMIAITSAVRVEAIGLRGFVEMRVAHDLELQRTRVDSGVSAVQERAARSSYWPKLQPAIAVAGDGVGSRSSELGAELVWNTGWGIELGVGGRWSDVAFPDGGRGKRRVLYRDVRLPLGRDMGRLPARARLEEARFVAAQSERGLAEETQRAILRGVADYFRLLRSRSSVRLADEALERAQKNLELSELKYSLGEISRIDRDRSEQRLREARAAQVNAVGDLETLQVEVAVATGLEELSEVDTDVGEHGDYVAAFDEAEALRRARLARSEFATLSEQEKVASNRERLARRVLWPNVALTYRRSEARDEGGAAPALEASDESWLITGRVPTDLGEAFAGIATARAEVAHLALAREALERALATEIAGRFSGLRRAEQLVANQEAALENARGQLEVAELRFAKGLGTAFDVVDSQAQLQAAEVANLDTLIERALRYYELLFSVRELTLERLVQ